MNNLAHNLSENGFVPDTLIRHGIRRLLQQRLLDIGADDTERVARDQALLISQMRAAPIAELTHKANEQHYEVPSDFFQHALGQRMKYSCAYWPDSIKTLEDAEVAALAATCARASVQNGMRILELGCGWGSLTLWVAENYPDCEITAVSNSVSQGRYIQQRVRQLDLSNVEIITADMKDYQAQGEYDRVLSIEMFEHMRSWPKLFKRISQWLKPDGKMFMHIFVHRCAPYLFEDSETNDWMSRHFFAGGMMPSADLPMLFQDDLEFEQRWSWHGLHYARTCNAWLSNMDRNKQVIWPIFEQTYGQDFAKLWWMRWRMFFMACAELFTFNQGQEWFVGHYCFSNRRQA